MSAHSSNSVAIATLLFAALASVLWVDFPARTSSSEAIGHVRQEGSDHVYLLQARPLSVELREVDDVATGSATFVVDSAGATGFGAQQLADQKQVVNSASIAGAATGLPAELVPAAGVLSLSETVEKGLASGRNAIRTTGGLMRNIVVDYLQLGAARMSVTSISIILPVVFVLTLLSVLCAYTILRGDQRRHSQLQGHGAGHSALEERTVHDSLGHSHTVVRTPSHKQIRHVQKQNAHKPPVSMMSPAGLQSPDEMVNASPAAPSIKQVAGSTMDPSEPLTSLPAPLRPQIALPGREASFRVPVHALTEASKEGSLGISSNSGKRLLTVTVKAGQSSDRSMFVSHAGLSSAALVTIGPPASGPRSDRGLEICGADRSLYGMLFRRPTGHYDVVKDDQTQMTITHQSVDMRLTVVNAVGENVASLTCGGGGGGGSLHLEVVVHPNVDAVLVLSCVLAVIVLC